MGCRKSSRERGEHRKREGLEEEEAERWGGRDGLGGGFRSQGARADRAGFSLRAKEATEGLK